MTDTKAGDLNLSARVRIALLALVPVAAVWTGLMLSPIPFRPNEAWLALALTVGPVVVAALPVRVSSAHQWARLRGADFEASVLPVLSRHLVRSRVGRTLGVTVGIGASTMLLARYNADPDSFSWYLDHWVGGKWLWLSALGYVVATIATELTKPRLDGAESTVASAGRTSRREPSPDTAPVPRAAILARRGLAEFLDPFIAGALMVTAGAAFLSSGIGALVVALDQRGWSVSGARAEAAMFAVVGLLALGAALAIAHRRNPTADNVALAYEELTRTATINALAGTAAAMFLLYSLEVVWLAADSTAPIVSGVGFVGTLLGLSLWVSSGTSLVFRSRRLDRIRGAA